ncbi:hypothetical protein [Subtercola vilae]|uniref:Phage tail tape measure protein n=1 Tax=Subtercola vilae TaxID=2056433 RepID=A0A4T2BV51_9MICO|nr:hypothetical protein [Subtercola vilae]TIH33676.1 hypothetical protein D4765_14430 [Subtercola vilae]
MANEGATTVGSIKGILDLDRAKWIEAIGLTRRDVAELGQMQPTIRVDANVSEALAAIEAVHVAEAGLGSSNANVTVRGSSAGAVGATAAATAAERAHGRAAAEAAASVALLDREQDAASTSALREAVSQDVVAGASNRAANANQNNAGQITTIIAAVAALVPLASPLAAGAIGIAGALAGMGAAGVLAIFGIKAAMAEGSAEGVAYSSSLKTLKSDFNTLAQTSAVQFLSSFQQMTATANNAMPVLNHEISQFSGLLGRTTVNLFSGAVTSLITLNPLLLTAGAYIEGLSAKFRAWTSGGGLEKFTAYAMQNLPTVEAVLGALATAVMHILEALAPMGAVGLTVLGGISNAIASIPVEVLGALISAITWGTLAFKAWVFVTPMVEAISAALTAMGVSADIAIGPIGWVIAGVAALAAVVISLTAANNTATQSQVDYTAAITADTGAIGENVRAKAARALQDAGAFTAAQKLGISTQTLTEATLADGAARQQVTGIIDKARGVLEGSLQTGAKVTASQAAQAVAAGTVRDAMTSQSAAIQTQVQLNQQYAASIQDQTGATQTNAAAARVSVAAYQAAAASMAGMADQTQQTTAKMYLQNDAAGLLKQSLDLLNGKAISYAQAQNQFDSQIASVTSSLQGQNGALKDGAASLDSNTVAGTAARGELLNLTTSAQATAQAFRDQGGSAQDTENKLNDMKRSIVDNAVAHGENRDAVQTYIDKIFAIPTSVPPTKVEVDNAAALAAIQATRDAINSLPASKSIHISTDNTVTYSDARDTAAAGTKAFGGTIERHAAGGTSGGTAYGPGSASSDSIHTLLSAGEEVISNRKGQATTWRPVLKAINAGMPLPSVASSNATGTQSQAPSERPIYMDGTLFGVIRQMANGEAQLVVNKAAAQRQVALSAGLKATALA